MLRNYLIIAWRNITKNKSISLINVSGLSLGLACSLLICLWVWDELRYDGFHTKGSRLYKVLADEKYHNGQE
jgi:hypothetical protein